MVLMLWMTEWPQCHEGEVGEVAELSYRAITARYSARMKACVYKKTIQVTQYVSVELAGIYEHEGMLERCVFIYQIC